MSFAESVRTLANQITERSKIVATEEAVKQALILPFLSLLGFDIYNPHELVPEYKAGWAKQTEKIDYAVQLSGKLALFVEAKGPYEALVNYDAQLSKYFNSTPEVKFAIITNGVKYRFFTDLQEPNILDRKPFFEFDFGDFTDQDISVLERFRKEVFNVSNLVGYAEDLVFLTALKGQFMDLVREPSDEFISFSIKSTTLVNGKITQKVIDRFRPLVKESISSAILEIVGQSFKPSSPPVEMPEASQNEVAEPLAESQTEEPQPRIVTTAEELEIFELVSGLVSESVPETQKLSYRDSESYFSINYGKATGWFVRVYSREKLGSCIWVRLPLERAAELAPGARMDSPPSMGGQARIFFTSVKELAEYGPIFVEAVAVVTR